mgnify:CR=1 FL=1
MENEDKKVLDLSMEAGRILLDAGAEIFRVEETIKRIAMAFGIEKCSPFVMSTGIFLTAENEEGEMYASVKHIPIQGAKLHRIAAVNQLSREIVEGKYTIEEAEKRLEEIKKEPGKSFMTGFRILAALVIFVGAGMSMAAAWDIADILMALMCLINIPACLVLGGTAVKVMKDYERQKKEGRDPVFRAADVGLNLDEVEYWK